MKKMTFIAVALIAVSFASCKKDRTCTCTTDSTSTVTTSAGSTVVNNSGTPQVNIYTKSKKSTAMANCLSEKYSDAQSGTGYTSKTDYVTTCTLK